MKMKYLLIIFIICSIFFVGCDKKEIKYEKHLISFLYSYGNIKEGSNDISITYNNKVIYKSSNSANKSPYVEKEIDDSILKQLENIIKKYNVLDWDGFNKYDDIKDNNEIGFSIQIGYDDGSNYNASGYMNYPKNFNKVHKELITLFSQLNNK